MTKALMKLFRYQGMSLPSNDAEKLVELGYLKWVEPQRGIKMFILTEKGKKAQDKYESMNRSLRIV